MRYRIDYFRWILRLFLCDCFLPVAVVLVPLILRLLFQVNHNSVALLIVFGAILVGTIRAVVGFRRIASNAAGKWLKRLQSIALVAACFWMVLADTLVMTVGTYDNRGFTQELMVIATVSYIAYLLPMLLASYPGRTLPPDDDDTDWLP
jgi:choline-glycine betaine transporter